MKHGSFPTLKEVAGSFNQKGDLVEYLLYDYFSAYNYDVNLLKTKFNDEKYPYETSQRFSWDSDIIVPDLICQNRYKDLLFIESKSEWFDEGKNPSTSKYIKIKTFDSYMKFYNDVFRNGENIDSPANVLICFANVEYLENRGGRINMNFIKTNVLNELPKKKHWNRQNIPCWLWRQEDLLENSYQNRNTVFKYNPETNIFSSKYCDDIYAKERDVMIVEDVVNMRDVLMDWIWN